MYIYSKIGRHHKIALNLNNFPGILIIKQHSNSKYIISLSNVTAEDIHKKYYILYASMTTKIYGMSDCYKYI